MMNEALTKNNNWFSRKNAFSFLNNRESVLRIETVLDIIRVAKDEGGTKYKIRLLDVGCGDGFITNKIKNLGIDVYSIDSVKDNVTKCRKMGIKALKGDVGKVMPYEDAFFDYVFAGEIIEHILDTKNFLNELNRVLKKDGKLLITTPNLAHLPDRIRLLKGLNPAQVTPIHEFLHLHIRPFTLNSLTYCLELSGFKVKQVKSTMVVFEWEGDEVVLGTRLLAKMIPTLGNTLIVESEKVI